MKRIEHFDQSRRALERAQWMQRQTERLYQSSLETIERSRALLRAVGDIHPTFKSDPT